MKQITQLSVNAQKLYSFLKETGGAWEYKCIEAIYPKPDYLSNPAAHWQWEANCDGQTYTRPVKGIHQENYSKEISQAYQELRKAGLADERNSGYNDYFFYPIK